MIPITKLYVFDTTGLLCVVEFEDTNFTVQIEWPEEVSLRGAKFVATALKFKSETGKEILKASKNLIAYIGDKYILACNYRKISEESVIDVLRKIYEILSAVKTFDPNEIGEVAGKAIVAEFSK